MKDPSRSGAAVLLAAFGLDGCPAEMIQAEPGKLLIRVQGPGGPVAVKEMHHNLGRSLWALAAQRHVAARGGNVAPVLPARDGRLVVDLGGRLFAAYGWLQGRRPNPADRRDWLAMVQGLAAFHQASAGYAPPEGARPSAKLGRWVHHDEVMLRQIRECHDLLPARLGGAAARQLAPLFAEALHQGLGALADLKASPYEDWCRQVQAAGSNLCHQDYGEGNALLTARGPYVLDLDGVTWDLVSRDLRKLAYKDASRRGWQPAALAELLQTYAAVHPLPPPERSVLLADLRFPHGFHAVVKNLRREPVAPARIIRAAQHEADKLRCLAGLGR